VRTEKGIGFAYTIMLTTIPRNKIEVYFAETSEDIIGCTQDISRFQYCVLSNKELCSFKKRIMHKNDRRVIHEGCPFQQRRELRA
jgi:hypothetical protein